MHRRPTFGSLFAGIGGLELGLERAGWACAWQVEIHPYCRQVLERHWPDVKRHDDVRTFPPAGTVPADWRVDLVAGGDPCQGNSKAGSIHKRKHDDLGSEFVRVVAELRPPLVLRENPYPHRPDALWPWHRMRAELERLGYLVVPFRLRSCCLGACHRRERVWLFGHRADADGLADAGQGRGATLGAAGQVQGEVRQQRVRADAGAAPGGADGADADRQRLEGVDGEGLPQGDAGGAGGGDGWAERRRHRVPAPRVCRSRHEVPHVMDRVAALGNAIDPVCAEWIGRVMLESLEETRWL